MKLWKWIASGVLWLLASASCWAGTNIWLTATSNLHPWPGTASAPFYVRNAAALTAILTTNTPDCTFHYAAGTYKTYGYYWRQRETANKGCKHYGAGSDKTIIQLVGADSGPCGVIFGGDGDHLMDGFELHDMTLDCNAVHNARYTNGIGACSAIQMGGNNLLVDGVKVIGFGTGNTNVECFPMYVGPLLLGYNTPTNLHDVVVQHCIVCSPAPTNACGVSPVSVLAAPGYAMSNCVIRSCTVSNLVGHFPYGPHAFCAPLVENCLGENLSIGVYFEPGFVDDAHRDWIVRSNLFKNIDRGIYISYPPGERIKSITFEGNTFVLTCPPSTGFGCWGPTPSQGEGIDWLVLRNNTIIQTNCPVPGSVGFRLARVANAVVQSNQMILGPGIGLMLDSSSVSNVWFSGNIDAAGALLPVTNSFLGLLSSQPGATQWPQTRPPAVRVRLQAGL